MTPKPSEGSAPVKREAISRSNSEPQGRAFWDEVKPLLECKLDPKHIHKPNGRFGPKGDYIQGWHAIAEANRIFGYGNWSYEIDLRQDDIREVKNAKGEQQWQAAYTCVCTVTVLDVTRQDVGFGSGFAKNIGDAIEGATKEAATDALKRALRTFGNPFGLALYDNTRANVGVDTPNHAAEGLRDAWEDGVLDSLPEDPSPETLAEGYAETMLAEIEAYKQLKALTHYYNRHKEHLAFVQEHLPAAYEGLASAFRRKREELTPEGKAA